jgi:hypothetical protein
MPAIKRFRRYDETTLDGLAGNAGEIYINTDDWSLRVMDGSTAGGHPIGGGSGTPSGSDTQVQFNDGSAFGGDAGLTFNKTTNVMTNTGGQVVLAGGTVTTSTPVLSATQTWNDAGVTFTAIDVNVTSTASASASKVLDLRVGDTSVMTVRKDGRFWLSNDADAGFYRNAAGQIQSTAALNSSHYMWLNNNTDPTIYFGASSDASISRTAAGILALSGVFEFTERTAPSAPASNKVRLYAEDNGAGKTRLMALFNSGAAQQVAIEP